jgi:hypothetical protein
MFSGDMGEHCREKERDIISPRIRIRKNKDAEMLGPQGLTESEKEPR